MAHKIKDVCDGVIQYGIHGLAGEVCTHLAEIADNEGRLSDVASIPILINLRLAPGCSATWKAS
jgi:hypothetical protein